MLKKNQCAWHIGQPGDVSAKAYCGKPVKWKIVKDDDENDKREYFPFCPEHQSIADSQEESE